MYPKPVFKAKYQGLDANDTSTVTEEFMTSDYPVGAAEVRGVSGTHTTHCLCLETSFDDGQTWLGTGTMVVGEGVVNWGMDTDGPERATDLCRFRVAIPEGSDSSIDIYVTMRTP